MTTLLAWTSTARQEALLLADDRVAGSSQRKDKIQVLYGRWAVGVYGSSLLQWMVEDLAYFNDKAKRPAIRSVVALLGLLGRVAQKTLPTRLRWLAEAGLPAQQIEAFLAVPSGYVILDAVRTTLWHLHLRCARELPEVRPEGAVRKCAAGRLWIFGQARDGTGVRADALRGRSPQPKDLRRELQKIARAHPECVGNPGSMVTVRQGLISVFPVWHDLEEYISNQMGSDPHYLRNI